MELLTEMNKEQNCEIYLRMKDFPDYLACSDGSIVSCKNEKVRTLKPSKNKGGYYVVGLTVNAKTKTHYVHKLIAMAFLHHKPNGHKLVVDHIDNDKSNNRLDNLQIITNRENNSKDKKLGSSKYIGVSFCKTRNKWKSAIYIMGKHKSLGYFDNELDAANKYKEAFKKANELLNNK